MQLYKLSEQAQAAMANMKAMLENDEIDAESYEDTMEALTGELEDKVVNVGLHIKNLRSDAEALKTAKAEMDARLKSVQSNIDFYEGYLFKHMQANSIEKAGNEYIELKVKKMPDMVAITDDKKVPKKYLSPINHVVRSPDKKEIYRALKKGKSITGAELITGRKALSIK